MSDSVAVRCAAAAWLALLAASTVLSVVAVVLPRWIAVYVTQRSDGSPLVDVDVGLWQSCWRYPGNNASSVANCSAFGPGTTAGWFYGVELMGVLSCVLSGVCVVRLCCLLARYDCWRVRPHTLCASALSTALLATGLLELAAVILCGVNVHRTLPVCIDVCPADLQPLASCTVSPVHSTDCDPISSVSYVIAVVGAGLALTSGFVGVAVSREPNGILGSGHSDDEPLLDGINSIVTSRPMNESVSE